MQAGRGIHQHRAGIHFPDESHRGAIMTGHDGIGMSGPERRDVSKAFVEILDDLNAQLRRLPFLFPILVLGCSNPLMPGHGHDAHHGDGFRTADEIHRKFTEQPPEQARQQLPRDGLMDQHRIGGIGGNRILNLGIHHDPLSQRHVRVFVDVDVTHAAVIPQDRDPRLLHHGFTQARFSPGNDAMHHVAQPGQFKDSLTIGTIHKRQSPLRHTVLFRRLTQDPG